MVQYQKKATLLVTLNREDISDICDFQMWNLQLFVKLVYSMKIPKIHYYIKLIIIIN